MSPGESPGKVKLLVKRIKDLPTIPQVLAKVSTVVNNPKSSAKDLAKIISEDQVLTARLLKLVNSSFYGFPQKVTTVTGAIVLLGFEAIRKLVLSTSLINILQVNHNAKEAARELWDHALCCGIVAKLIGEKTKYTDAEELFVAGLLHDIGKVVQLNFFYDDYYEITKRSKIENIESRLIEVDVFGIGHDQMGVLLARYWNLPKKLEDAMGFHHTPFQANNNQVIVSIVHVANVLAHCITMSMGEDTVLPELDKEVWKQLQLTDIDIDSVIGRTLVFFNELKQTIT